MYVASLEELVVSWERMAWRDGETEFVALQTCGENN